MIKVSYLYENGVEEGKMPFNLDVFEYFPEHVVQSIRVDYCHGWYETVIKLDPFYISGNEIDAIMVNINVEEKRVFMASNLWTLLLSTKGKKSKP